jgi:hypothetical protein
MPRYVLLGLAGKDVDVLSRLSRLDPRPEVLVVHPDPGALILRLADVAQMPALTEPPRARADDVVVVSSSPHEEIAEWAQSWREVGARIVLPDGIQRASEVSPAVHAAVSAQAAAAASALSAMTPLGRVSTTHPAPVAQAPPNPPEETPVRHDEIASSATGNGSHHPPEPKPESEPAHAAAPVTASTPAPAVDPTPSVEASARAPEVELGSATAWESPEATFRYLVEQTLGRDAAITLWWNGGVDAWVPWIWTGVSAGARPEDSGDVLALRTECGEFQVSGAGERRGRLNLVALTRVAEDLALRDLMRWRREARALAAHGLPDPNAEKGALARWMAPVLAALEGAAALMWRREGEGWRLVYAQGEGLGLDGTFTVPAALFEATFEAESSPWRRWEPAADLRVHLQVKGDDPRWPLRLRRVQLALAGEETAW